MRTIITLAAAATALMVTPVAASASPPNGAEFEVTVKHDDLDLTTSEGASRLDERVRTRVFQMCRNGGRDSASQRLERQCRAGAFAAAETQVRLAIAEANADRARFAANTSTPASDATTPGA